MRKKVKIILIILIIIVAVFVSLRMYFSKAEGKARYFICSEHEIWPYCGSKEGIPCSTHRDCWSDRVNDYCEENAGVMLIYPPDSSLKYYCGSEGYCKKCRCGSLYFYFQRFSIIKGP